MKHHSLKLLIIFLCCFLFSGSSFSQFKYGLKSGINITSLKDFAAYPKIKVGWYAGGLIKIALSQKVFIQPELLYSSKGGAAARAFRPGNIVFRFNYLTLPIVIGYKLSTRLSFDVGPEFSYILSATAAYSQGSRIDVSNNYPHKTDFALVGSVNYKILSHFIIGARYNYGFKTIYYLDDYGSRTDPRYAANRVFQVGANYLF